MIKASTCGRSEITLQVELVKSSSEYAILDEGTGLNHVMAVTSGLLSPRIHMNRMFCAGFYFRLTQPAKVSQLKGLRLIVVFKRAAKRYPNLGSNPMNGRGK